MRILVLSDSHRRLLNININEYDYIIHCGDYGNEYNFLNNNNLLYVKGNCDIYGPKERKININNKTILITHGDLYNVKYNLTNLTYKGLSENANIVFYGHTHIQYYFYSDNILYINPGSYQNNDYIIINDNDIYFYNNGKLVDKISYNWR